MVSASLALQADSPHACPICRADGVRDHCRKESAHYVRCGNCGLIFQHPQPTTAEMRTWADAEYRRGAYHDYVSAKPMKLRHFEDRLREIADLITPPGRLLDVGCSCGYFMEVAASRGFEVSGVEFSKTAIEASSPSIRGRIFEGMLHDRPDDGPFDVISAFDLFEHVPDPRGFLNRCRSLLKPGGALLITTPDTGHPLRFVMRCRWPMLQPMQHLFLFSKRSLSQVLTQEGFHAVAVRTCYKTISIDYLIKQIQPLNPWLSGALAGLCRIVPDESLKAFRRVNIGEILAVARRI